MERLDTDVGLPSIAGDPGSDADCAQHIRRAALAPDDRFGRLAHDDPYRHSEHLVGRTDQIVDARHVELIQPEPVLCGDGWGEPWNPVRDVLLAPEGGVE